MTNRGNTTTITLLVLALAALVGLAFAPLQLRECGHRLALVDRVLPNLRPHHCRAAALMGDLRTIYRSVYQYRKDHGRLEESLSEMVPPDSFSDTYKWGGYYKFDYSHGATSAEWQVRVARTSSLPGWYLLNSDGQIHFNENIGAHLQDPVLEEVPLLAKKS